MFGVDTIVPGGWRRATRWSPIDRRQARHPAKVMRGAGRDRAVRRCTAGTSPQLAGPAKSRARCYRMPMRSTDDLLPLTSSVSTPMPTNPMCWQGTDRSRSAGCMAYRRSCNAECAGTSMTSKTVAALLADPEVTRSQVAATGVQPTTRAPTSRHQDVEVRTGVSRALRTRSRRQGNSRTPSRHWSNHEHRHTEHYGSAHTRRRALRVRPPTTAADRRTVLTQARARHPHRFRQPVGAPKILDLPDTVWINRPAQNTTQETATTAA